MRFSCDAGSFNGMAEAYPALVRLVLERGRDIGVRDSLQTVELLNVSWDIGDVQNRGVPIGCGRKVGPTMMAIDGLTNLAGASYPDLFLYIAPFLGRFADKYDPERMSSNQIRNSNWPSDGRWFAGQYGPRTAKWTSIVEEELRRDWSSRRAVIQLWEQEDTDPQWRDRPCATHSQFLIRDGALHQSVSMRSNDLFSGVTYDVFQFGQIQAALANVLAVPVGVYHHHATSLHAYVDDIPRLREVKPWPHPLVPAVHNEREVESPPWAWMHPSERYESMAHVRERFRDLASRVQARITSPKVTFEPANAVEDWYWQILAGAVDRKNAAANG